MTDPQKSLRDHVLDLLRGGSAHLSFDKAVEGVPPHLRGAKVEPVPHTPWRLLEHLRIAQWDILQFTTDPKHTSPAWPEGYWPDGDAPPDDAAWDRTVAAYRTDSKAVQALVADPNTDLFARVPGGDGQTVLREAFLVADHAAYHLGQLVVVRRLLGCWPEGG
ncbi:MAG TPA: DinB family protein [Urbifossiella sp.]|jgi:hypothetical protein|nr:DinB family protein [Urbifossiella sp.]